MSLRIRLPPSEGRVEGSRDAEDLVAPPGAATEGDDEQVTGDPARAGLGRDRREREAPRRVAVREAGELDRMPDAVEKEEPRPQAGGVDFFFQAEDGIRDYKVTGVQTCALPI